MARADWARVRARAAPRDGRRDRAGSPARADRSPPPRPAYAGREGRVARAARCPAEARERGEERETCGCRRPEAGVLVARGRRRAAPRTALAQDPIVVP